MSNPHGRWRRRSGDQSSEAGFLMPLAATSALVLLLSSLSVQAAVLHSRRLQLHQAQRHQQDDQLSSAAHHLGADLQGPYRCLLSSPSVQWRAGLRPAGCPSELDPQRWLERLEHQHAMELSSWQPLDDEGQSGRLQLQRAGGGGRRTWHWQAGVGLREVAG